MRHHNLQVTGSVSVNGISAATAADLGAYTASADTKISTLQSFTASVGTTNTFTASANSRLNSIETISASNIARIESLETISASNIARIGSLEATSASVDSLNTTQNTRLANLEIKTGSLATTGSNTFIGTQTITGSLYISSDLIVQGTSSLQNITASAVSIGTNIVNLNTANPAIRYAGLVIGDSGSVGGSGSFLYDSVQDEMIFVHRGSSTVVTSSVVLMGPQTFDNVGNETYPTNNIIQKGTGNEHLVDSSIFDNGTTVCINANLKSNSNACVTSVCSPAFVGGTISGTTGVFSSSTTAANFISDGTAFYAISLKGRASDNYGAIGFYSNNGSTRTGYIQYGTICGGQVNITGDGGGSITLDNRGIVANGVTTFSNVICSSGIISSGNLQINGTSSGKIVAFPNYSNNNVGLALYNTAGTEVIYLNGNVGQIGATSMVSTYFSGTCLTLNSFSSGNGFKMDYGNASGEITAINLMANGTTNGFIGIQMVDGSNGDLWLGSSANRSVTIYRTGNVGFNTNNPCTRIHAEGGYGARFGCNSYFYGGGVAGGQFPYGDQYGNGASYTYQEPNTTATNTSLFGGYAAGYFRGGNGGGYGGGGAGIVAIGGDGGNAESVNSGGGAGLFARAGKNGAGSAHSFAGWFDGGNVIVRCGNLGVGTNSPISLLQVGCIGNSTIRLGTSSTTSTSASYSFGAWNSTGGDILTVRGDGLVAFAKINDFTTGNAANTWINPNSSWGIYINTSSCRYKRNISNYDKGIDTVNQLRPVYYKGISEVDGDKQFVGLIAEEIHDLGLTEFVNYNDEGLPNSLSYPNMIALAFNAIKEQQCTINTLKSCLGIN